MHLLITQRNAWIHLAATVLVAGAAWFLQVSASDWIALVLAMAAVWTAEALNTALELLCDATSPEDHPLVGKAKDVAAGAVLVTAMAAMIIGALVFWPAVSCSHPRSVGAVEYVQPAGLHAHPAFSQVAVVSGPVQTIYIGGQNAVDGPVTSWVWVTSARRPPRCRAIC